MSLRVKDKPKTPEERVRRYRERFDEWNNQWAEIFRELDLDMKCLSLDGPWDEKERLARATPGAERPCLHEDILSQFHNQVINAMEMNPHGADVQPQGGEADEHSAEFIEDRLRQIDYEQNGQHAYMTAGATAVMCSLGYWKLETEYANAFSWDKQIRIVAVMDPKTIVYDPYCKKPDWSDATGAFELSRMTHDEFRDKYPKAEIRSFDGYISNSDYGAWIDADSVQVAVCWDVVSAKRKLLKLDDGSPEGMDVYDDEIPAGMKRQGNAKARYYEAMDDSATSAGYPKGTRLPILNERSSEKIQVFKVITNGIEILDETEFEDEEIPIMVTTGRVKYENGKRVIESLTRKGRIGQMRYDYLISGEHELIAITQKPKYEGFEGQFDTNTDLGKSLRTNIAYAEFKAKTEATGDQILPLPAFRTYEPPIQALEMAKASIIQGVQNAIGMSTTEAADRVAKSGKALESLQQTMNVTTYHFYNSQRIAQLRGYRQMVRLLKKIENSPRKVGLRNVKGEHSVKDLPMTQDGEQSVHSLDHQVVIGSGKEYQSQIEKQNDLATQLLQLKDPNLTAAVLPAAIRMMGLGEIGDEFAEEMEAVQPPAIQQVREARKQKAEGQPQIPPKVHQVIQAQQQQSQQLQQMVQKLQQDAQMETIRYEFEKWKCEQDNRTKVEVATIQASVKERIETLDQQSTAARHIADVLVGHEQDGVDRAHELQVQQNDQAHAAGLQQSSQDAAAQQAALAQQTQPEQVGAGA